MAVTALDSDVAALRQRLMGGTVPVPSIIEQPGLSQTPSTDAGGGSPGDAPPGIPERDLSTADFPDLADLPASDPMSLDRLTALRPELSLSMPSFWVLVRNPLEVEQYLQSSYGSGALAGGAAGSVSVALWIDENGSVEWAEISRSSGRPDVDRVALALFSEVAEFRPARDEGVAVPVSVVFSVRFPWY
jgi:TonB family protein